MKFYIVGPEDGGCGAYHMFSERGEHLASHFSSSANFALGDLERNRPERQKEWHDKFGEYEVVYIDSDIDMTREKLIQLNHKFYSDNDVAAREKLSKEPAIIFYDIKNLTTE